MVEFLQLSHGRFVRINCYLSSVNSSMSYAPSCSTTRKAIRSWNKKHSLKKIRFHDLRHTCATMLIEANVPMKTVSTFMGHANIQITLDTYAHCTKDMEQQAADAMDKILSAVI